MRRALVALSLAFALNAAAQSEDLINPDRPGIADGSQTVGRGRFQIEVGAERDDDEGARNLITPLLLRYGLTDRLELRVEGNGYQHLSVGGFTASGFAPLSIGAKFHVADHPSLGIIARVFPPSGSGEFRSEETTADLRLATDVELNDRWSVEGNIGAVSTTDDVGRFTAGLAALTVTYAPTKKLGIFVDAGLQSPEERFGSYGLILDTGATWLLDRNTQLDASIGWGAHGLTPPQVFFAAGVSRRF